MASLHRGLSSVCCLGSSWDGFEYSSSSKYAVIIGRKGLSVLRGSNCKSYSARSLFVLCCSASWERFQLGTYSISRP